MIILSKANLVDKGTDLDQLIADLNLRDLEIFPMNNQTKKGVKELEEILIYCHEKIREVFNNLLITPYLFLFCLLRRIIQPPSPTFAKPSLTN